MKKLSLVLVTVDCLRADHAGFLGYSRPTTPFLDELAGESFVFSRAIVAGAPTYYSFPAIMASRFPLGLGRDVSGIAPGEPTIASAMRSRGFATAGFVAGNPYLSAKFGYQQGFDYFNGFLSSDTHSAFQAKPKNWSSRLNDRVHRCSQRHSLTDRFYEELYFRYCQWRSKAVPVSMDSLRPYPSAKVLVDQVGSWLSTKADQPFFLWVHLMDPHHPYYPPEEALAFFDDRIIARRACFLNSYWNRSLPGRRLRRYRDQIISLYDAGIRWADMQLARLVESLRQFGKWDETVFVLTADHGEEFLEQHRKYHSPVALAEGLIRVPLLVRVPGLAGTRLPDIPFTLLDLAPTLLDVLEMESPSSFMGESAWPHMLNGQLPSKPAITECIDGCLNPDSAADSARPRILAVTDGQYKLVLCFAEKWEKLYDLHCDPGENTPLPLEDNLPVRRRLLEQARRHLRANYSDSELRMRARLQDFRREAETVPQSGVLEEA